MLGTIQNYNISSPTRRHSTSILPDHDPEMIQIQGSCWPRVLLPVKIKRRSGKKEEKELVKGKRRRRMSSSKENYYRIADSTHVSANLIRLDSDVFALQQSPSWEESLTLTQAPEERQAQHCYYWKPTTAHERRNQLSRRRISGLVPSKILKKSARRRVTFKSDESEPRKMETTQGD